jgi:hypothetical protein
LRTPWPYLGGLAALVVFSPHLLWNVQNDWITMRFQLGHGFANEAAPLLTSALPDAVPAGPQTADPAPGGPEARALSVLSYLGTQAALWGLLLIPLLAALVRHRRQPAADVQGCSLDPGTLPLLWAGTLVPLLFFALIASIGAPEANWPVMYLLSAAPLAAVALARRPAWAWVAAAGNGLLATLYALHAATAALPLGGGADRILRETHGYRELAVQVAALEGLVFADGYQTAAMLRFYQPGLKLTQWPGITRPSEYLRGVIAPPVGLEQIQDAGGFWLVGRKFVPPLIRGFAAQGSRVFIDCKATGLIELEVGSPQGVSPPCPRPLHRWQVVRYAPDGGSGQASRQQP